MRLKYIHGDIIKNNIIFLQYVITNTKDRYALFKCHCGNEWVSKITYIKTNKTSSCGCNQQKHGLREHSLYYTHSSMISRCYNINNIGYARYGGRGIEVAEDLKKLSDYIEYIESLPNAYIKGYSIDRINNDNGYKKGNLRWVSRTIQSINQKINKNNKTGYVGVRQNNDKFQSYVSYKNKQHQLGSNFKTSHRAVFARNRFIVEMGFPHKIQQIII